MTYRDPSWDAAERRPATRQARPARRHSLAYDARIVLDAVLLFAAIVVLVTVTSTGYAP